MKKTNYKLDPPEAPEPNVASNDFPHPGLWVRSMIEEAGYSIPKAAAAMAINRANFNDVCRGPTGQKPYGVAVSRDLAYRLDALLNTDGEPGDLAKLLIDRQAQYDWEKEASLRRVIRVGVKASMKSIAAREKRESA